MYVFADKEDKKREPENAEKIKQMTVEEAAEWNDDQYKCDRVHRFHKCFMKKQENVCT